MTTVQPPRKIRLALYKPHAGQLRLHNARARFRVACWGRRAGKTLGCCNEHTKKGVERRHSLNWWVGPTYKQAEIAFETIVRAMRDQMTSRPNYTDLKFKLYSSEFVFRSGEKPDNLRGDGIHHLTMDECRNIRARVWFEILMPMLTDTDGDADFISSPQGHDWFYQLYRYGQDPLEPEYWSFSAPSTINPYLPRDFIEEMRRKLPEDTFSQEILAVFLADAATVFKRVDSIIRQPERVIEGNTYSEPPLIGHHYVLGWDPAKHLDFSVIIVLDVSDSNRLVCFDRDNQTDYRIQILRVVAMAYKYNRASVSMDATGVGDPLMERLQEADLSVDGVVFTNPRKQTMVEKLQLAIEHQQTSLPNIAIIIAELKAYGYKITASRHIIYGAPDSQEDGVKMHDDCVSAYMLAIDGAGEAGEIALVRGASSSGIVIPTPRRFDDPELDKHLDEDKRTEIDRRQASTQRILQQLLDGRFGL
jgi:hypothetical protein